jgi:acetylornithine deacetylase
MSNSNESSSLLQRLIAYPTVSRDSNLQLIEYLQQFLSDRGIDSTLTHNDEQTKANLYAVVGPTDRPGVMLSGHTDVVPVDGQDWSSDPFVMDTRDARHYGRGSADMKGFIACVLSLVDRLDASRLNTPIHLAFSYDEEIGCVGVRRMLDMLEHAAVKPRFCIVGEPTSMQLAVAHKGKNAGQVQCHGVECHSSMAPLGLNAIHLAVATVDAFREEQKHLIDHGAHDDHYEIPHTTIHIGTIQGGTALNIVPNQCQMQFEIRNLPDDDPGEILSRLQNRCDAIVAPHLKSFPSAGISVQFTNSYPALDTAAESEVVRFVRSLTGANSLTKLAFGTEGGLFSQRLGIETVVIGPGSIDQAHKPDEFIEQTELDRCDAFLDRLIEALSE